MKKVLSILLALSFVVQPAYSVAQPAQAPKKGVITKAKEKWSAMKEAVKKGNAVLKANWQCITKGKGEKCSPDRHLALQVIRNFVKGNSKAAQEAFKKLIQAHKDCWVPVLVMLVGAGFITTVATTSLFEITPKQIGAVTGGGAVAFSPMTIPILVSWIGERGWKKFGKCMLVIGLDLPIVIALSVIIYKMVRDYETSEPRIDMPRGEDKSTLLHAAVRGRNIEGVRELIAKGAKLDEQDKDGATPLHIAVSKGNTEIAKLLLDKGADPNIPNNEGFTPLHVAVENGNKGIAEFLLSKGADYNKQTNRGGNTPLHWAAYKGYKDIAKLLIDRNANLHLTNFITGNTPLHMAARQGDKDIAKLLIDRNANLHLKNLIGNTPLHMAAIKGDEAMVDLLLKAEEGKETTSTNMKNKQGQVPRDLTTKPALQKKLEHHEWRPSSLAGK